MTATDDREIRRAGYQSACINGKPIGAEGAQAESLRVPLADGTLVATPELPSDALIPSFLAASDVLGTGWFGAVAAEAGPAMCSTSACRSKRPPRATRPWTSAGPSRPCGHRCQIPG